MTKISFDFHGTLSRTPSFWQELLRFIKSKDVEIFIISGYWPHKLREKLGSKGYIKEIHYDNVFSILSHLSNKGMDTWYDEDQDSWQSGQNEWWAAKAEICKSMNCQIHFDNDIRFAPAFENIATRFVDTVNQENVRLINQWHADLKLADTYDDWEDGYMSMMSGMVPM